MAEADSVCQISRGRRARDRERGGGIEIDIGQPPILWEADAGDAGRHALCLLCLQRPKTDGIRLSNRPTQKSYTRGVLDWFGREMDG